MSASFLWRARWLTWCSTSTSVTVRSGTPAACMQRTIQRLKAFHATIMPNSNSDASTLRGDTRCDDDTMPCARCAAAREGGLVAIRVYPKSLGKLQIIC